MTFLWWCSSSSSSGVCHQRPCLSHMIEIVMTLLGVIRGSRCAVGMGIIRDGISTNQCRMMIVVVVGGGCRHGTVILDMIHIPTNHNSIIWWWFGMPIITVTMTHTSTINSTSTNIRSSSSSIRRCCRSTETHGEL